MTRTPTTVLPQTLTFLVEESRVCEAEALVRLLAQGNGHAVWNRGLAEEWRAHLAASGVNLGDYPLFPLLYVRNNQLPRAARSFRDYATAADAPAEDRFRTFLEMLRLLWNKRQVPLEKYKGKLKRDRTNLITTERALLGRDRLFDEGWALLEGVGHPQGLYAIALSPEWVVYPVVRQFLDSARDRLELQGTLPPWWVQADIKTAVYGEDLAQLETLAPQIAGAGFNPDETRSLERRYFRQIARLKELAVREAERAQREAAYLASIRSEWLDALARLPILERSRSAWNEYQDLRDHFVPVAIGTPEELLPQLPRQSTYTVWEVGEILPFTPQKQVRIRQLKGRVLKVNPQETVSYACACLEHYRVEEGLRRPEVTHFVILRLKDAAFALFNVAPKTED